MWAGQLMTLLNHSSVRTAMFTKIALHLRMIYSYFLTGTIWQFKDKQKNENEKSFEFKTLLFFSILFPAIL